MKRWRKTFPEETPHGTRAYRPAVLKNGGRVTKLDRRCRAQVSPPWPAVKSTEKICITIRQLGKFYPTTASKPPIGYTQDINTNEKRSKYTRQSDKIGKQRKNVMTCEKWMGCAEPGQGTDTIDGVRFGRPSRPQASPPGRGWVRVPTPTPSPAGCFPYPPRGVSSPPVGSPCFLTLNEPACPVVTAWLVNALWLATR